MGNCAMEDFGLLSSRLLLLVEIMGGRSEVLEGLLTACSWGTDEL